MNNPSLENTELSHHTDLNTSADCHIDAILQSSKHSRALGVIIIVLFVGILLSFLLNFGISAYLDTGELVDGYFDGEEHDNIALSKFADAFYLSGSIRKSITYVDYYLFGRIRATDIILGDENFLFPTYDAVNEYNYIADYYGELKPEPYELKSYYKGLLDIKEAYAELGVDCYIAVITNAQTVYSERMPEFMGNISEYTRLQSVTDYFTNLQIENYLDLTKHLQYAKQYGELYNNTEDSLNSLGAYYAYRAVIEMLPPEVKRVINPITLNEDDLVIHSTNGKVLARSAGLESVIKNNTVSLSTDFVQKYQILLRYENYDMAFAKMQYRNDLPTNPRIEFSFSSDWDRIIMIDYFSNTFGTTIYRNSIDFDSNVIQKAAPSIHIIFLTEKNLDRLADGTLLPKKARPTR